MTNVIKKIMREKHVMDILLTEVKETLYFRANELLSKEGYRGNKQLNRFKKTESNCEIEFYYLYNDYSPLYYKFNFFFYIKYKKLENRFEDFIKSNNYTNWAKYHFILKEGDFAIKATADNGKIRSIFSNVIGSRMDLEKSIIESNSRLTGAVLPFIQNIDTLEKFKEFIVQNPEIIIQNIASNQILSASLLALKDWNLEKYRYVVDYVRNYLEDDFKKSGINPTKALEILDNIEKSKA